MLKLIKGFLKDEEGMGTIEIVVIIAVLVALALLFQEQIGKFANSLMGKFFTTPTKPEFSMPPTQNP